MEYPFELVDDIIIWYHPKLQIQQGYQSIVIHVKRFLFHQWLTIEGAQGMAIFPVYNFVFYGRTIDILYFGDIIFLPARLH